MDDTVLFYYNYAIIFGRVTKSMIICQNENMAYDMAKLAFHYAIKAHELA